MDGASPGRDAHIAVSYDADHRTGALDNRHKPAVVSPPDGGHRAEVALRRDVPTFVFIMSLTIMVANSEIPEPSRTVVPNSNGSCRRLLGSQP